MNIHKKLLFLTIANLALTAILAIILCFNGKPTQSYHTFLSTNEITQVESTFVYTNICSCSNQCDFTPQHEELLKSIASGVFELRSYADAEFYLKTKALYPDTPLITLDIMKNRIKFYDTIEETIEYYLNPTNSSY